MNYEASKARWAYNCLYRDYMGNDYVMSSKEVPKGEYILDMNRYETAV